MLTLARPLYLTPSRDLCIRMAVTQYGDDWAIAIPAGTHLATFDTSTSISDTPHSKIATREARELIALAECADAVTMQERTCRPERFALCACGAMR